MAGGSPRFLQALRAGEGPEPVRTRVQEQDLQQWGLTGESAEEARERAGAGKARGGAGLRWDGRVARSFPVTLAPPSLRFPADWACALTCCGSLITLKAALDALSSKVCTVLYLLCFRVKPTCHYESHVWGSHMREPQVFRHQI